MRDRKQMAQGWASATLLVSCAFVVAFFLTFGVLVDVERQISAPLANFTSLIFLPHGVRVLSAWLYGWQSSLYMLPGVIVAYLYLYGFYIDAGLAAGHVVGLICAPLAFTLLRAAGMDLRPSRRRRTHWRDMLLVGAVASVFNSGFSGLAYRNDLATMSARFVGDIAGTLVCLLLLMGAFRLHDRMRWR